MSEELASGDVVTETEISFRSRCSLAFYVTVSRAFSILSQLRLETIHLTRGETDDFSTIKSNNFGKSTTHSSSASMIK